MLRQTTGSTKCAKHVRRPTAKMDYITAYCMIIPPLIILGIFVFWPLYESLSKSLTDWNFYNTTFVGLKNYQVALHVKLVQR